MIISFTSEFANILSKLALWQFNILPRIGSTAWNSLFLANLRVPDALSPSTMKTSHFFLASGPSDQASASLEANFKGALVSSLTPLAFSLALRAASLAFLALSALSRINLMSAGEDANQS